MSCNPFLLQQQQSLDWQYRKNMLKFQVEIAH